MHDRVTDPTEQRYQPARPRGRSIAQNREDVTGSEIATNGMNNRTNIIIIPHEVLPQRGQRWISRDVVKQLSQVWWVPSTVRESVTLRKLTHGMRWEPSVARRNPSLVFLRV